MVSAEIFNRLKPETEKIIAEERTGFTTETNVQVESTDGELPTTPLTLTDDLKRRIQSSRVKCLVGSPFLWHRN